MQRWLRKIQKIPRLAIGGSLLVIAAASIFWANTQAAGSRASFEAEAGSPTTGAAVVTDGAASGGKAVKFSSDMASGCHIPDRVTVTSANQSTYPAYPLGAKIYTPGGPDPWGGCFPDASSTGYPHGLPGDTRTPVTLTNYTGPCIITTPNVTIDRKDVKCGLDIRAQNVTITNSNIHGRIYLDDTRMSTASFSVSDTTLFVDDIGTRALMYGSYTATRVDASGGGSMAECRNCTIKDSYFHDPLEDPTGHAHNSTVRLGEYANLIHNTLHCNVAEIPATDGSGDISGCSANQTAYSHDGIPPYNTTAQYNFYMAGNGGYCGYGGSTGGAGADQVHDVTFLHNIFQRGSASSDWGSDVYMCGWWGPMTSLDLSRPGNQWTDNRWDNGKPFEITGDGWQTTWSDACGTQPNCTWAP